MTTVNTIPAPPLAGRSSVVRRRACGAGLAIAVVGAILGAPPAHAALPDLGVTMTGPSTATQGTTATYVMTVANDGTVGATDVVLRYLLVDKSGQALPKPANITPFGGSTIDAATTTAAGGSCATGTVVTVAPVGPVGPVGPVAPGGYTAKEATCRLGGLAAGATATVTITVGVQLSTFLVVQPAGAIVGTANVYSDDNTSDDATEAATVAQRTAGEDDQADNVAGVTTALTP